MAAVETVLGHARAEGRAVLITYVTAGIRADWLDLLRVMIDAGADAVEIGMPFSDPMLDGPAIQQASSTAISRGTIIGFGIDTPERAAAAAKYADGVIVASALMRRVMDGSPSAEIGHCVREIRTAIDNAR